MEHADLPTFASRVAREMLDAVPDLTNKGMCVGIYDEGKRFHTFRWMRFIDAPTGDHAKRNGEMAFCVHGYTAQARFAYWLPAFKARPLPIPSALSIAFTALKMALPLE
jgi:hypothetical protein